MREALGSFSMKAETSRKASEYLLAAGVVSTGKDDSRGISYGAYQLSSLKKTVNDFLKKKVQHGQLSLWV